MNFPKISVVTPVYNGAKYIEETILSVIGQNYPGLEYIIIDGGSTDGTVEIIRKYESSLYCWISEPDKGMYYAILKGFSRSTGDIMAWINSDDKYQPGSLFAVSKIFSDLPEIEWIIGMPSFYNSEGICVKISSERRWAESRFYAGDYRWIQQESVFWKRALWNRSGNEISISYKFAGDIDLWCRFFQQAQLFSVSTCLGGFRSHGNQISVQYSQEYEAEALRIIETIKPKSRDLRKYNIIRSLWKFRNYINGIRTFITKYTAVVLSWIIDKMHSFPHYVQYDFSENRWTK